MGNTQRCSAFSSPNSQAGRREGGLGRSPCLSGAFTTSCLLPLLPQHLLLGLRPFSLTFIRVASGPFLCLHMPYLSPPGLDEGSSLWLVSPHPAPSFSI